MLEILVIRPSRIFVDQRRLAIRIPLILTRLQSDEDRHDDVESLGLAARQILVRFLTVEPHEQVPRGIAQIEKRLAVFEQVALVGADTQLGSLQRGRGAQQQER